MGEIPSVRPASNVRTRPSGSEFGGEPGLFSNTDRGDPLKPWLERSALSSTDPADPLAEPRVGKGGDRVL